MIRPFKLWLASGFGAGLLPVFPGTWGSMLALVPIWFIFHSENPTLCIVFFILGCTAANFWVAKTAEEAWGADPPKMVMDEWAGLSLCFVANSPANLPIPDYVFFLLGFILFRLFDIIKPLGIKKIQKLNGGFGILADDLLAGVYAFIVLQLIILLVS